MNRQIFKVILTGVFVLSICGCVKRVEQPAQKNSSEIIVDKQEFLRLAKIRLDSRDSAMSASRYISPAINPGDQLTINIYEKLPVSQDKRIEIKRVSESGAVLLPPIGVIQVGGLSVSEAAKLIEGKLANFIVSPFCEVEITQHGYQPRYFVFGEVGNSGTFFLKPGDRLLDGLSAAGGCSNNAYRRSIKLVRIYDKKVGLISINLLDIMSDGKVADNIVLQDQDIIFIPRRFLTTYNEVMSTLGGLIPWYFFINNL